MRTLKNYGVIARAALAEVRNYCKKLGRPAPRRAVIEALDRRLLLMGVTATSVGSTQINLTISADSGAAYMEIDRSTDDITFSPIFEGSASYSYADTSLSSDTTYYYNVSDNVGGGASPLGSASTSCTTGPAAPTFNVATTGGSTILLSSISCDSAATAMQIYESTDDSNWLNIYSGSVAGSYPVTGLSVDTQYYFYITDSTSAGTSDVPYPNSATTGPSPGSVDPTTTSSNSILVTPSPDATATAMVIYQSTSPSGGWSSIYSGPIVSSYSATGLSSATGYYFYMTDSNSNGPSDNTVSWGGATTLPTTPTFSATATSGSSILLSSISCDAAATAMQVYQSTDGTTWGTAIYNGSVASSYSVSGLSSNTQYYFYMTDSISYGASDDTSIISATTGPVPTFSLSCNGSTSINVGSISCDATATAMQIYVSTDDWTWTQIYNGAVQSSYTATGLSSGTEYFFYMTDSNSDGTSDPTTGQPQYTGPAAPIDLAATAPFPTTIDLQWTNLGDSSDTDDIYISTDDSSFTDLGTTNAGASHAVITGAYPNTTYYIYLIAHDGIGDFSDPSETVSVTTPPAIGYGGGVPPQAPPCSCNGDQQTSTGTLTIETSDPEDGQDDPGAGDAASGPIFTSIVISDDPGAVVSPFNGLGGVNTTLEGIPTIADENGDLVAVDSTTDLKYFNGSTFAEAFGGTDVLAYNSTSDLYTITDSSGTVTTYYGFTQGVLAGKAESVEDSEGVTIDYSYNSDGTPASIYRSLTNGSTVTDDLFTYNYLGSGDPNAGRISSIVLTRSINGGSYFGVQESDYTYYDSGASHGNLGDLETAVTKDGSGNVTDSEYYRYYTGESGGAVGALKYVVGMDSYARLAASLSSGTTPLTATDSQLAPYADMYYAYDGEGRVTTRVLQGEGCSSCAGGLGTFTFSYASSGNTLGYNSWATKTVETLPDDTVQTYYYNGYNELMLEVITDPVSGRSEGTFTEYDSEGRTILSADSDAVIIPASLATLEQYTDLLHSVSGSYQYLASNAGEITTTSYYGSTTATTSTAGGVEGYVEETAIQLGQSGTSIPQEAEDYIALNSSGPIVYELADDTLYGETGSGDARTTSYSYTVYSGTTQIKQETITMPGISTGQNGPGTGSPDTETTVFDTFGRPVWTKDGNGFITYMAYDDGTGALIKEITDVNTADTSEFTNLPSGWSTPSGGGLNLITTYHVSAGRKTA